MWACVAYGYEAFLHSNNIWKENENILLVRCNQIIPRAVQLLHYSHPERCLSLLYVKSSAIHCVLIVSF